MKMSTAFLITVLFVILIPEDDYLYLRREEEGSFAGFGYLYNPITESALAQHIPICAGKVDGLYPDPNSCLRYYRCREKRQFHESCPEGTVFNPHTRNCDYRRNVPTCQGYTWSEIGSCVDKEDGYYQNPANCKSYYQCTAGKQQFYTCPLGTIFDESVEVCNFPKNVRKRNCKLLT